MAAIKDSIKIFEREILKGEKRLIWIGKQGGGRGGHLRPPRGRGGRGATVESSREAECKESGGVRAKAEFKLKIERQNFYENSFLKSVLDEKATNNCQKLKDRHFVSN